MVILNQPPLQETKPGLIGIIAQDSARFTSFASSLTSMNVPAGSMMEWVTGHEIPSSQNILVRSLLQHPHLDWLMILGDDHVMNSDLLVNLLAHEVDIVGSCCLTRFPPYRTLAAVEDDSGEKIGIDITNYPNGGLIRVSRCGGAGMVVRRRVFEAMNDPWFEYGHIDRQELSEDLYFCDKAVEAGFPIHYDLDTFLGHTITGSVWPVHLEDGTWLYGFSLAGGLTITMPELHP